MIKDLNISAKVQKSIISIAIVVYAMLIMANVVYATDTLGMGGGFNEFFTNEIAIPTLLPLVLFIIGYTLLKNKSNQTRIFNSIIFLASCFLLSTITQFAYSNIFTNTNNFNWIQSNTIAASVQIVSVVALSAFFSKIKNNVIPRLFQIYLITLTLLILAINAYYVAFFGIGISSSFWVMDTFIPAVLSITYVYIGYTTLTNVATKTHRLFLACISTALAMITWETTIPINNVFQDPLSSAVYVMGAGYLVATLVYVLSIKKFRQL